MFKLSYFERLVETVNVLVRHPEYANKGRVLERCKVEVSDLVDAGRITEHEARVLLEILDSYTPQGVGFAVRTAAGRN